jgi:hypothetical protein
VERAAQPREQVASSASVQCRREPVRWHDPCSRPRCPRRDTEDHVDVITGRASNETRGATRRNRAATCGPPNQPGELECVSGQTSMHAGPPARRRTCRT